MRKKHRNGKGKGQKHNGIKRAKKLLPKGHQGVKLQNNDDKIKGAYDISQKQVMAKICQRKGLIASTVEKEIINHRPKHIGQEDGFDPAEVEGTVIGNGRAQKIF